MKTKRILIASLFAAIMLTVPFTVVSHDPRFTDRVTEDDSKLAKESDQEYTIPEYIDITDLRLSREELANLKQLSDFLSELIPATEEYFDVEITVIYVPVIQDGIEIMTLTLFGDDLILLDEGASMALGGCFSHLRKAIKAGFIAVMTHNSNAGQAASEHWNDFLDCMGWTSSSSSNTQGMIETITTGETVEVSEIFEAVEMMEGETYDCGCN